MTVQPDEEGDFRVDSGQCMVRTRRLLELDVYGVLKLYTEPLIDRISPFQLDGLRCVEWQTQWWRLDQRWSRIDLWMDWCLKLTWPNATVDDASIERGAIWQQCGTRWIDRLDAAEYDFNEKYCTAQFNIKCYAMICNVTVVYGVHLKVTEWELYTLTLVYSELITCGLVWLAVIYLAHVCISRNIMFRSWERVHIVGLIIKWMAIKRPLSNWT